MFGTDTQRALGLKREAEVTARLQIHQRKRSVGSWSRNPKPGHVASPRKRETHYLEAGECPVRQPEGSRFKL
ncbi:hypothetical protein AAFF_G00287420 [Aldrovandia affinis]|uniref:Uncharacterized protein n=1 Tax=Aldrovandia affinis TaxID=143900 RepID=A0AAD7WRT6_9TELE|nr:hypothetical protein AAFF_G00287420 [Aldrovandia affinis]